MARRVGVLALALALAAPARAEEPAFAAGQHWSYETRSEDAGSTLIVGRVEELERHGTVVHVSILDVNLRGPGGQLGHLIAHVPIDARALRKSVKKPLPPAPLPEQFESGYAEWRDAKGGVYTLSVREIVETIQRTLDAPRQ